MPLVPPQIYFRPDADGGASAVYDVPPHLKGCAAGKSVPMEHASISVRRREEFGLFLFHSEPGYVRAACAAGVTGIVVDWEKSGKHARQSGYDTQINDAGLDDLRRVREAASGTRVICRLNGFDAPQTCIELEAAVSAGADEVLLPMVRAVADVQQVIGWARGRCGVGIMVECLETLDILPLLGQLPLARAYIGLNDLQIAQKSSHLFVPIANGLVAQICTTLANIPVGFGGLTLPDHGHPIPSHLLMREMTRLNTHFSILRRSFLADVSQENLPLGLAQIRQAMTSFSERAPEDTARDFDALLVALHAAYPDKPPTSSMPHES